MKGATHLYTYRCSFCKAVATSPVRASRLLYCRSCARLMAFQFVEPIVTDEDRALAEQGVVFHRLPPTEPPREKVIRCRISDCLVYKPVSQMVHLPGIGEYCCAEHAAQGQAQWDAFMERMRLLREEQPDLWPTAPTKA